MARLMGMQTTNDDARSTSVTTDWMTETKGTSEYAEVNGINLYYETHGTGQPMILVHGGLGSGEMFGPILPALSERHQVIAVDLQGTAARPTSIGPSTSGSWLTTSGPSSITSGWRSRTSSAIRSAQESRSSPR